MYDDYQIPSIALIAALMLAFSYLHSRFRSVRTLLWMLALVCTGLQAILLWMVANWTIPHGAAIPVAVIWLKVAGECALMLSSALFLASLSPLTFVVGRVRVLFRRSLHTPHPDLRRSLFRVSQHPSQTIVWIYFLLASGQPPLRSHGACKQAQYPHLAPRRSSPFAGLISIPFFMHGDVYLPLMVVESGSMLMTALLVIYTFRRSPGVFLTTAGFFASAVPPFFLVIRP
jgi:hypothetical protein